MDSHLIALASKTSFRLAGLARIKPFIKKEHLAQLTDSLVMSLVRYAMEVTTALGAEKTSTNCS